MVTSSNPLGLQPLPLYFPRGKHMGRKGHHAYGFHREVKTRAKYGLRGFMPRNRVTPYECRRHEVRGCKPSSDTGVWKTRKCVNSLFFKRLHRFYDTPHFATRLRSQARTGLLILAPRGAATRASHAFICALCSSVLKNPVVFRHSPRCV